MVLIYEIDADDFRSVMVDYPDFATGMYIRGELRTAYFKYLTSLR